MYPNNTLFPLLPLSLLVCALAGCSPKPPAEPASSSADSAAPAQAAAPAATPSAAPVPDKSVPLSRYTRLDYDDERAVWLTYLVTAHASQATPDEELLNMFSPRYYNEQDAFKKRELATTELPRVKETLAGYKAQRYYSLQFNRPGTGLGAIAPMLHSVSGYDFDSRSFAVSNGSCLQKDSYFNQQQAGIQFESTTPAQCAIKVADADLARKIEALRVAQDLGLTGVIHFWVKQVDGNQIKAVVTGVHYELYDKRSPASAVTPLASVDV